MDFHTLMLFAYNITLIPVLFFSVIFMTLTLLSLWADRKKREYANPEQLPFVSVHIPTYNDPIASRCVKKCMEFTYPKDKYEIIIADDSTNPETRTLLEKFSKDNPGFIKYIHRDNREGFKPGALKNAMKITKGELIVVFDSDFIPKKQFLKKVIQPFSDKNVAIVQTRQGFYNYNTNIITRFASYLLMIYHMILMPINDKINCVFFCGTAGAIRRSALEAVGGWNINSITEDTEISVKILLKGYKTAYLEYETPSEVPETFESFIKQQMRWCYGTSRVFFDNAPQILFGKGIKLHQRLMISLITLLNISAIIVVLMTIFGLGGWALGEPRLVTFSDFIDFASKWAITAGFLSAGIVTLYKRKQLSETGQFILSITTMGLVLAVCNSIAFSRSVLNRKLHWFCTPKTANYQALENDSS